MSQEDTQTAVAATEAAPLTGKAKKAQRSAERHKKGKKAKPETTATEEATSDTKNNVADQIAAISAETTSDKSKKRKQREWEADKEGQDASKAETTDPVVPADQKPAKKPKKNKDKTKAKTTSTVSDSARDGDDSTAPAAAVAGEEDGATTDPAKNQRFIVFIGNLPFTATTETVTAHFASIKPTSVRLMTDKQTKRPKGFAFLEFENYDRMKTCLKLYHHSEFDSGVGGDKGKRRINVELTAGGGGKSEGRKEKLKEKNVRLEEQRKRRAEALAKQEARKDKKGAGAGKGKEEEAGKKKGDRRPHEVVQAEAEGVHPARLAMMRN